MSEIKLDSDALNALVLKSILDGITPEQRDAFIGSAVKQLLVAPPDHYGRKQPTPLQTALETAVNTAVYQAANRLVAGNEALTAKLEEMIGSAIAVILAQDHDERIMREVAEALATAILRGER